MAKLCSRPPGFAAPFCWGDFCGTRLQNRLDRVAVDFACPPAGSINSACQIFSLLCWAHSVAEQCINIHGDQSRASGEREYGAEVCGERERKRAAVEGHTARAQQDYTQPTVCHLFSNFPLLTEATTMTSLCLTLWHLCAWFQPKEDVSRVTLPFQHDYFML